MIAAGLNDAMVHLEDELVRLSAVLVDSSSSGGADRLAGCQPPYMRLHGRRLLRAGFDIIPVTRNSKKPCLLHWRALRDRPRHEKLRVIDRYSTSSIGVDTTNTPAVDIDCDDSEVVDQLRREMVDRYGPMVHRAGQGNRIALLFQCDTPFSKLVSGEWRDATGRRQKLEVLGEGQQLVAYGYHPDTGLPYTWYENAASRGLTRVSRAALPLLSHKDARYWTDRFDTLAVQRGWTELTTDTAHSQERLPQSRTKPLDITLEALETVVMAVPGVDDYHQWITVGMAVHHQTDGSDEGLAIWSKWASQSHKFDLGKNEEKWAGFRSDGKDRVVTARTVFRLAGIALPLDPNLISAGVSEDAIALAFAERHTEDLRYDHHVGQWYHFDSSLWKADETEQAFDFAREICRSLAEGNPNDRARTVLAKSSTVSAIERMARTDRRFAVTSAIWDTDPYLLGTPGGSIDLRTGLLRSADRSDHMTMSTAITPLDKIVPERDLPVFLSFLRQATCNDQTLIRYIQQWGGYCLTGDTREQVLQFIHGPGRNGKSLLQNVLGGIMGTYSWAAPPEMFLSAKHDRHPTELAAMRGKRLVTACENENGRQWAEVRIKQITGGDRITARKMRQDFFEFDPQAKFQFIGNNKPKLSNVDEAMRRRFHVIEFKFRPKKPDSTLASRIRAEWPAILRWFIDGSLDWQRNGFQLPAALLKATDDYFAEQDVVQDWIEEWCDVGEGLVASNGELKASFEQFAYFRGATRDRDILDELRKKGFEPFKNKFGIRGRGYVGLCPAGDEDDE